MTSNPKTIALVLYYIRELNKHGELNKVLDIGIGFGKYGFLIREYCETPYGRVKKGEYEKVIDGVEPFVDGITFQRELYDTIYECSAQEFTPEKQYDVILWIDILEHMPKEEALATFERIHHNGKLNIIATPKTFIEQDLKVNTFFDQHRSLIAPEDFGKEFERLDTDKNCNHIYVIKG